MCEVKMVSIEELRNTIHNEEIKLIAAEVEEKRIINAEKRKEREQLLSGPTEYIDMLRKANVPINVTDIKQAVRPTKSKILESLDWQERLVATHAQGHVHALYLRMSAFSLLFAVYMWL